MSESSPPAPPPQSPGESPSSGAFVGADARSTAAWVLEKLQPHILAVSQSRTPAAIACAVLNAVDEWVKVEHTGFYFYDLKSDRFSLVLARGLTEEERRLAEATAMERHPGWVIRNRRTYFWDDHTGNEANVETSGKNYSNHVRIRSRLYCPLLADGVPLGTLGLASSRSGVFNDFDRSLLQLLCEVAAASYARILSAQRLEQAVTRLSTLVDTTHAGILIEDEARKLVYCNSEFCRVFGISVPPEQMKGADCEAALQLVKDLFQDPQAFVGSVHEALRDRKVRRSEQFEMTNGRVLLRDFIPLEIHGENQGILWNYRDITEEVQAQRELEAERLRSAYSSRMASLGEMAGGIAHEINSPLATIVMLSGQIRDLLQDGEVDAQVLQKKSEKLQKTGERIAKIIRTMRSFARDGSRDPMETVSISELLEQSFVLCAESFKLLGIELRVKEYDPALRVRCRSSEVIQVILNLLNNARDAIAGSEKPWVEVQVKGDSPHLEVWVTDSGSGISEELVQKLFQPFFTTKPVGKGTGLGLGISKRIMESHGGALLYDQESKHTRFKVIFQSL